MDGGRWSGILHVADDQWLGSSHGQKVKISLATSLDRKVMVYNWKMSCTMGSVHHDSHLIDIPSADQIDYYKIKEVCAGIGGIASGMSALGFYTVASMDINPFMCNTLRAQGHQQVIEGDLLNVNDRLQLHQQPEVLRCTLCAGFPCQPLSQQGDQRGADDPRSLPFHSVLQLMWEQQHGAMVLECVPGAQTAPWVQQGLQKLAWSLGMHFEQRILQLERTWPCRRTRWWLYMVPRHYSIATMSDLPLDLRFQQLEQLFPTWASWSLEEMEELYVPEEHMTKLQNELYGTDLRRLHHQRPCPCILHSYSFSLSACPCGCRTHPFSEARLRTAGLRGFFVHDETSGKARYLHVKEAALLCTVDPLMDFGSSAREKLCLIGQVAAPLQAMWVGTFLQEALNLLQESRETMVMRFKWHLLRRAIQAWPDWQPDSIQLYDEQCNNWICLQSSHRPKVADILLAEQRLHHAAMTHHLKDQWGLLPRKAFATASHIANPLMLHSTPKRQCRALPTGILQHRILCWHDDDLLLKTVQLPSGCFVFEVFATVNIWVALTGIKDEHDRLWRSDDRLHEPTTFTAYMSRDDHLIMASGDSSQSGISDLCLDGAACRLLAIAAKTRRYWISAAISTSLAMQDEWHLEDAHPFLGALHGQVFTAIALENHWYLVELKVAGTLLSVNVWNGLDVHDGMHINRLASRITTSLALRGFAIAHQFWFGQHHEHTCGAVALLHLGSLLEIWTLTTSPDEQDLYDFVTSHFGVRGRFFALGKNSATSSDQDTIWQLRDILKSKGVDDSHTEERAMAAMNKIGATKLQEALHASNPWQALKSLGSAPRVNFMWVKPDELERQIRARAQSKFHIAKSNKKTAVPRSKFNEAPLDPSLLGLIPDSFMTHEGNPVLPLSMDQVGTDCAGLAFGLVSQVIPFLKEGASLSLDALGVLTTAPVPVESHGLLPVTNIRFPAMYLPTQEPILIDGSLIQLGDITIVRHREGEPVALEAVPTGTLKLSVYRDEWPESWDEFTKSPMKQVTMHFPKLILCKGNRCGGTCAKYHPPVDTELDGVILDLWSRSWQTMKGKKTSPMEADQFQVLIRVPHICMNLIQLFSGTNGFYAEPRHDDGKAPADGSVVVWLPPGSLDDAVHRSKTVERVQAICRFGLKYGLRVLQNDAETAHSKVNPDVPFHDFQIQLVYEVRPLPHGTQKAGMVQLLKKWHWKARPLQPYRSDPQGMGWLVGSAQEPPAMLLHADQGDVTVVLHKKISTAASGPTVLSTLKTRSHMKQQPAQDKPINKSDIGKPPGLQIDPWANWNDPWARSSTTPIQTGDVTMTAASRVDQLEERVANTVANQVQQHLQQGANGEFEQKAEARFQRMEVDLSELKQQHQKYENWFQDAASVSSGLQNQIGELRTQVREQGHELGAVRTEIQSGFQHMEALFAKKHRAE